MFMGIFHGAATLEARRAAGLPTSLPCPKDFDTVFVLIGRQACEEWYRVGRATVTRWLDDRGKELLISARSDHVRSQARTRLRACPPDFAAAFPYLGLKGCRRRYRADWRQIYRWLEECGREKLIEARRRQTGDRDVGRHVRLMGNVIGNACQV
jgi:hypothetical protein